MHEQFRYILCIDSSTAGTLWHECVCMVTYDQVEFSMGVCIVLSRPLWKGRSGVSPSMHRLRPPQVHGALLHVCYSLWPVPIPETKNRNVVILCTAAVVEF